MLSDEQIETLAKIAERLGSVLFFVLILGYVFKPERFSVTLIILLIALGVIGYGLAVWLRRDRHWNSMIGADRCPAWMANPNLLVPYHRPRPRGCAAVGSR